MLEPDTFSSVVKRGLIAFLSGGKLNGDMEFTFKIFKLDEKYRAIIGGTFSHYITFSH